MVREATARVAATAEYPAKRWPTAYARAGMLTCALAGLAFPAMRLTLSWVGRPAMPNTMLAVTTTVMAVERTAAVTLLDLALT